MFLGIHAKCTTRQTYAFYHNTYTFTKNMFYRNTNCMNFTRDKYIFCRIIRFERYFSTWIKNCILELNLAHHNQG